MKDPRPQPIRRQDYRPPSHLVDRVELEVDLDPARTEVRAKLAVRRNPDVAGTPPLRLDGERLELVAVTVDGRALSPEEYRVDEDSLTIEGLPERFELGTAVRIQPESNTELSGLFVSGPTLATQCEAEGFRRITYFPDRPDVMARYTTTLVADAARYPVLLSNGNRTAAGARPDGRHFATWDDPFPKPCYLFAIVAGPLACLEDTHVTPSGRRVNLQIWVEPHDLDACQHALTSLRDAMRFDEEVYGLEYDLDTYMVVAVADFNMAAMENKGLNLFNAKYVLARPDTATDDDYEDIAAVIAHEYFHNWTGNRVTCRDWFQLTLKEGLTVFRDEQFTAAHTSEAVKRIQDVMLLRTSQFAEDRSPSAHPIRPEAYIEMNNFYTVTVYHKGAEVVRMMQTLLGREGFRRGMDLYFQRHDGQAVTCDDFRRAMADANGRDLAQFGRWYEQVGTPELEVERHWEPQAQRFGVTVRQFPGERPDASKMLLHVPVALGLLDARGHDVALVPEDETVIVRGTTAVLELREPAQTFWFRDVASEPVPSLLRGFSAPVRLRGTRSVEELSFLMAHDADPFARWDAAQTFARDHLLALAADDALPVDPRLPAALGRVLHDAALDDSMKALMLHLPDERALAQSIDAVDPDALWRARERARVAVADALTADLWATFRSRVATGPYRHDAASIGARRLRHAALSALARSSDTATRKAAIAAAADQFANAQDMTSRRAALGELVEAGDPHRAAALLQFHTQWHHDPLVLDKWFEVQARSGREDTVDRVQALTAHPDFDLGRPNRVRALIGVFSVHNQVRFHAPDGRGYRILTDAMLALDPRNPQAAARLVGPLAAFRAFEPGRAALMRAELERVAATADLSRDVSELVGKALAG